MLCVSSSLFIIGLFVDCRQICFMSEWNYTFCIQKVLWFYLNRTAVKDIFSVQCISYNTFPWRLFKFGHYFGFTFIQCNISNLTGGLKRERPKLEHQDGYIPVLFTSFLLIKCPCKACMYIIFPRDMTLQSEPKQDNWCQDHLNLMLMDRNQTPLQSVNCWSSVLHKQMVFPVYTHQAWGKKLKFKFYMYVSELNKKSHGLCDSFCFSCTLKSLIYCVRTSLCFLLFSPSFLKSLYLKNCFVLNIKGLKAIVECLVLCIYTVFILINVPWCTLVSAYIC